MSTMSEYMQQFNDWPTIEEYDSALENWLSTVDDPDIGGKTPKTQFKGLYHLAGGTSFVRLYQVDTWVLRCFGRAKGRKPPRHIIDRYNTFIRFCTTHQHSVSALVPIRFCREPIPVGKNSFPVVIMPFLAGMPSLGKFLLDHYRDRSLMEELCTAWERMILEMEEAHMAHGDLDLTNVLVDQRGTSLVLKLIDYDNVWLPNVPDWPEVQYGHPDFQHPAFLSPRDRPYNQEMDRFSALSIYISLKLLASHPHFYDEWGADDAHRLLFSIDDYKKECPLISRETISSNTNEKRFQSIYNLNIPVIIPYVDELLASLQEARQPRSLDQISQGSDGVHKRPPLSIEHTFEQQGLSLLLDQDEEVEFPSRGIPPLTFTPIPDSSFSEADTTLIRHFSTPREYASSNTFTTEVPILIDAEDDGDYYDHFKPFEPAPALDDDTTEDDEHTQPEREHMDFSEEEYGEEAGEESYPFDMTTAPHEPQIGEATQPIPEIENGAYDPRVTIPYQSGYSVDDDRVAPRLDEYNYPPGASQMMAEPSRRVPTYTHAPKRPSQSTLWMSIVILVLMCIVLSLVVILATRMR